MRAELTRSLVDTDAVLAGERRDRAAAEERAARAEQLRSRADDRVEDYRAQLEENRRREADRGQEHRDRVAELRACISDLTQIHQREA